MTPDVALLDRYRPLLHLHARQLRLGRLYQARFDASDVVQETYLRAIAALDQVRGRSEPELVRWLQTILANVLTDLVRRHGADRRDPRLERSVAADASDRETPLGAYLAASDPGPSTVAGRQEELLRLATAIGTLPEIEQDAIVAHHILKLPVAEVAIRLGRTEKGAAGVLYRAMDRLRKLLGGEAIQ